MQLHTATVVSGHPEVMLSITVITFIDLIEYIR